MSRLPVYLALPVIIVFCLSMRWYVTAAAFIGGVAGMSLSIVLRRPHAAILAAIGAIVASLATVPLWLDKYVSLQDTRGGAEYLFDLDSTHSYLDEGLALSTARKTLELDGYVPQAWNPVEDGRTASPDGIRDKYLCRNALTVNRGYIVFERV